MSVKKFKLALFVETFGFKNTPTIPPPPQKKNKKQKKKTNPLPAEKVQSPDW